MEELSKFGRLIKELRTVSTNSDKTRLILELVPRLHCFQAMLWLQMLNPYITFGVSDIPAEPVHFDTGPYTPDSSGLMRLLNDLATRNLSGAGAQLAVRAYFDKLDSDGRIGFRAIITRKPRCGVGAALLNSIHRGWIPEYFVQKARRWNEKECKALLNRAGGAIVEVKLDGERRLYINRQDSGQPSVFLTSRGNEDHGFPYIIQWLDQHTAPGTVLDGELVANGGKLKTRQSHLSKHIGSTIVNTPDCGVYFSVFDVMDRDCWIEQSCPATQHQRSQWLTDYMPPHTSDTPARRTRMERVVTMDQLDSLYFQLVDAGYEGVIIKNPIGTYEFKKSASGHWIKRKFETGEEVTIIDVLPGDVGGKYQYTFGRFYCRRANGVDVMVGRGRMADELGNWVWENRADLPGRIIEILHNGETPDKSLNHARFFAFRDDKVAP